MKKISNFLFYLNIENFCDALIENGLTEHVSNNVRLNKFNIMMFFYLNKNFFYDTLKNSNYEKIINSCIKIIKKDNNLLFYLIKITNLLNEIDKLNKKDLIEKIINLFNIEDEEELILFFGILLNSNVVTWDGKRFGKNDYISNTRLSKEFVEITNNNKLFRNDYFELNNDKQNECINFELNNIESNKSIEINEKTQYKNVLSYFNENKNNTNIEFSIIKKFILNSIEFVELEREFNKQKSEIKKIIFNFYHDCNKFPEFYIKNIYDFSNTPKRTIATWRSYFTKDSLRYLQMYSKYFECSRLPIADRKIMDEICSKYFKFENGNMSIEDYVKVIKTNLISENDKHSLEMFLYKIEGKTLNEIGIFYGITRERVRQILNKIKSIIPQTLIEYKYYYLVNEYEIDFEIFNKITNLPIMSFNFLNEISSPNFDKKSKFELLETIDDKDFINLYLKNNKIIKIDDEFKKLIPSNILINILKKIKQQCMLVKF